MISNGDRILTDPTEISSHTVNYFENMFSSNPLFSKDFNMVDTIIPSLGGEATNKILTNIPSLDEITTAVFNLNIDSAPRPEGFGVVFFLKNTGI